MPNPSPTQGTPAQQNYSMSSHSPPSGSAPNYTTLQTNQSPSNANTNFSVPPNPSPSNQGNNYTIPNPNPSPAANSNTNYNLSNPSPGNTNYTNMPTPSPTNSNGSFTMAVPSPTANQQNFAVPQQPHHTQHHQGPPPQQAGPPPPQQAPQQQQQPQQQAPQQQQQQPPPPLPSSVAEMHHQPMMLNSYPPPPMAPHMVTHRLTHPGQTNSCAHSPSSMGPMTARMPGNFGNQNSSCSLAKIQQLTNSIPPSIQMELMPESTMTPPPNLTPPPMNPMTPPPSMQRDMSHNRTPPIPPNLQSQGAMSVAANHYKQYQRVGSGTGRSASAASLQKSPNVTVNPNMTFTPNVAIQPGTNVITGYNMMNLNLNRVPQQVWNTGYITNPGFSIQQPQMNMMGMNVMNMHPQAPNFQQQMPAAAQSNNVYTTYGGYSLSGMASQAYNLTNMNGHVMRR